MSSGTAPDVGGVTSTDTFGAGAVEAIISCMDGAIVATVDSDVDGAAEVGVSQVGVLTVVTVGAGVVSTALDVGIGTGGPAELDEHEETDGCDNVTGT